MSFMRWSGRGTMPGRAAGVVLGVGRRVSVGGTEGLRARVAVTDDAGGTVVGEFVAGAEVEILGWRPGGSHGVRYQVRGTQTGIEGWLAAESLRDPRVVTKPAAVVTDRSSAPASLDTARRFGQR